jgi:hypothetical protein
MLPKPAGPAPLVAGEGTGRGSPAQRGLAGAERVGQRSVWHPLAILAGGYVHPIPPR